jgi:DNA-binding transcriptional ArsR family regulator
MSDAGALDDLFGALADPTRRSLFRALVERGPQTATVLADDRPLSRQAVVKHLQALVDAGLATSARDGREVRYRATSEPLAGVVQWLVEASPQWDRRVERLVTSRRAAAVPAH